MAVLRLSAEADSAGVIHLDIPVGSTGNFDVEIVVSPKPKAGPQPTPEELGWPPGWIERTYGSIDDETFVAPKRHYTKLPELFE